MANPSEKQKPWDQGRKAYREPNEAPDGRPVITRDQFWSDETERQTYEHAAESYPRRPGEGPALTYMHRLAVVALGHLAKRPDKPMPAIVATEERLRLLQEQACQITREERREEQ
jgi:hypothetical protein